jgi:alkanesulfonate monooxygenase SsuD/methylene tetrahydromethanopterin reductase-like flavin-dependent oxidoreductase (luciferase family)
VNPPRKALACFEPGGQGVAIFSPASTVDWNFGPHGNDTSDDPKAASCMHVAPLDLAAIGAKSNYSFRYWLVVGTEAEIAERLDALWKIYASETVLLNDL